LNLTYVNTLIATLTKIRGIIIEKIDFVVVVPLENVSLFNKTGGEVVGELKTWKWTKKDLRRGLKRFKLKLVLCST